VGCSHYPQPGTGQLGAWMGWNTSWWKALGMKSCAGGDVIHVTCDEPDTREVHVKRSLLRKEEHG
jgi:hypothetical protein